MPVDEPDASRDENKTNLDDLSLSSPPADQFSAADEPAISLQNNQANSAVSNQEGEAPFAQAVEVPQPDEQPSLNNMASPEMLNTVENAADLPVVSSPMLPTVPPDETNSQVDLAADTLVSDAEIGTSLSTDLDSRATEGVTQPDPGVAGGDTVVSPGYHAELKAPASSDEGPDSPALGGQEDSVSVATGSMLPTVETIKSPDQAAITPSVGVETDVTPAVQAGSFDSAVPPVSHNNVAEVSQPEGVTTVSEEYVSNPFLNAIRGLVQILKTNPASALLVTVVWLLPYLLIYGLVLVIHSPFRSGYTPGSFGLLTILPLFLFFIVILAMGASFAVASCSVKSEKLSTGQAYKRALAKFFPMIGLGIIWVVLCMVSVVLLVVPAIIFVGRSSLAFFVLFEEDLGPIKALKRSFALTKGHTTEMLGSLMAGYALSGGLLLAGSTAVSPIVGRYVDLTNLEKSDGSKPKTHWLNYLAYLMIAVVAAVAVVIGVALSTLDKIGTSVTWQSSNVTAYSADVQVLSGDIHKINSDSTDSNLTGLQADCQQVASDVDHLASLPSYPDSYINTTIENGVATLKRGATECQSGLSTRDVNALNQAGTDLSTGLSDLIIAEQQMSGAGSTSTTQS